MASLESKAFSIFLKLIRKKSFLKKQFDFGKFDFYSSPEPPSEILDICNVEKQIVNNRNVFVLRPKNEPSGKHILYLHGGAYVQNFVKQHWVFLAGLVDSLSCTITAPDYPLAPKHTYRDSFDMVIPVYAAMVETVPVKNIILMGDSAGGGFALALAQHLQVLNMPQPAKIILLSPWLDLTLSNPAIKEIDSQDPFLGIDGLQQAGKSYAGDEDREMYMLSPINGALENLAKIYILVGTREILVADTRKLRKRMEEHNIDIDYHEYEDMIHVWMFLNFPESRRARKEIIRWIQQP